MHHYVEHIWHIVAFATFVEKLSIAIEQRTIILFLQSSEFNRHDSFFFWRNALFDVLFETTQQVRLQQFVQLLHLRRVFERAKTSQKLVERSEFHRLNEVEQRPQLCDVVLQRSATQQNSMLRFESTQIASQFRIDVLQTLSFINNNNLPLQMFSLILNKTKQKETK